MSLRRFFPNTIRQVDEAVGFVFDINTANTSTGSTTNTQFKLPLLSSGTYDFDVDWGDTTSDTITVWDEAETTHTYASTGTYTITITRKIEGWGFANTGDRLKILDIQNWGTVEYIGNVIGNVGNYQGCANLQVTATDSPIFLGGAAAFFRGCTALTGNASFNTWNMTPCTNTSNFFAACPNFNQNIGAWDMSNVTNIIAMFFGCTAFNNGGSPDINDWNVSNVTGFTALNAGLFLNCSNFNQPLNNWNMIGCTNTTQMFQGCTVFNQPLNNWNMSNVTTMQNMFVLARDFNQNIGSWNVSNVTNMQAMFGTTASFNNGGSPDINTWNTIKVSFFGNSNAGMFQNATAFNQPIGGWNTSAATNMRQMFQGATAFDQNIGSWNVSNLNNAPTSLFQFMSTKTNLTFSAANLDAIYNGWSALTFSVTGFTVSFGTAKYTAGGQAGRDILTGAPNNWAITDGGI